MNGGNVVTDQPTTSIPADLTVTTLNAPNLISGANGRAQLAPGGSAGYSNFTLNGDNNDGTRLGFIGGGASDPNLYIDVPEGGQIFFRIGSTSPVQINADGIVQGQ